MKFLLLERRFLLARKVLQRPRGITGNRCEIKSGVAGVRKPLHGQGLLHLKMGRLQGLSDCTGEWSHWHSLDTVGAAQASGQGRGHRIVPLPCPVAGEGQEHPPTEAGQSTSLSSCPLHPLGLHAPLLHGLIHLIYHGKLRNERLFWFICLESSWHSPGTV